MESPHRADVSNAPQTIGIITGLCALSTAVVAIRVWVRTQMTKQQLGMDDAFMIAAVVLNITESSLICVTTALGLGRHIEYVDPGKIMPFFKLAYGAILVYIALIFLIKQSLILFYWRLSRSSYFHKWCWAYLGMNTAVWLTFSMVCVFSCKPINHFWDRSIPGQCMSLERVYIINASFFVFMDVAALILPIPCVWRLNMRLKKKIQLVTLFSIGLFVCVASFVRMTTLFNFNTETDATWSMVKSNIWSMIEINIGIITVSAPVVKPFFTRILWPKVTGKSYHSSANTQSYAKGSGLGKPRGLSNPYATTTVGVGFSINDTVDPEGKGVGNGITVTTQHYIEHEMGPYNSRRAERRSIGSEDANSVATSYSTKELRITELQTMNPGLGRENNAI